MNRCEYFTGVVYINIFIFHFHEDVLLYQHHFGKKRTFLETAKDYYNRMSQDEQDLNALQENIKRKGKNAYYYAHANSSETIKIYEGAPQRIDSNHELPTALQKIKVKKYSWSDGKKVVKIYIPFSGIGTASDSISDESIRIDWTPRSLCVAITSEDDKCYELAFAKLHDEIKDASHRLKDDSIVVTISKVTEYSWQDLTSK